MGLTPEELYKEREKRVLDAIALKKPDRIPIMPHFSFFLQNTPDLPRKRLCTIQKSYGKPNGKP